MKIKKDDVVIVITGKEKGKTGKVVSTNPEKGTLIIKGVNMQTKHKKQTRTERSEITHKEGPVKISNVMFYDESKKQASRLGYKIDKNKKLRMSKKTGEAVK
jgi:large subunit ribosomal protein L24